MIIHYGQIYIQVGINFPFTLNFQVQLRNLVSACVECTDQFAKKYGKDWQIIIRISAKSELKDIEVKGPTIYRKDSQIEFTIFLPYGVIYNRAEWQSMAIESILDGTAVALEKLGLKSEALIAKKDAIVRDILSQESMIES